VTATANPDGLGRGAPEARLRVGLDGLLVADRVERRDDRPHEGNLTVDLGMVAIFGDGKACQLDRGGDALRVDKIVVRETRTDGDLGTLDVVRREECIRGTAREIDGGAFAIYHAACGVISRAYPPHVSNVVRERRENDMQPSVGGDVSGAGVGHAGCPVRPASQARCVRHRDRAHRSTINAR